MLGLVAACRHPAAPGGPRSVATCPPRAVGIAGACLNPDEAADYCGKAAKPDQGGCLRPACPPQETRDIASGECVPALALRKIAAMRHIDLKDEASLGCANAETSLVVDGSHVACIPHAVSCGRGARWMDGGCRSDIACPPGSVAQSPLTKVGEVASLVCVPVVHKERADALLDVGTWVRLVLGPDGGEGTAAVCGPLALRPGELGVVPHGKTTLEVEVRLVFPDNEVSAVVLARRRGDAHAEAAPAPPMIVDALSPLWKSLRLVGGTANAASATVTVQCPIESGPAPTAVPAGGTARDGGSDAKPDGRVSGGKS